MTPKHAIPLAAMKRIPGSLLTVSLCLLLAGAFSRCDSAAERATPSAYLTPVPSPTATQVGARDTAMATPNLPTTMSTAMPTRTPTAMPTSTPAPLPSPTDAPKVWWSWSEVNIPTYPFEPFLQPLGENPYGMQPYVLDREAYERSAPTPQAKSYKTLVVENAYLRLTFLPELGGRLYQCVLKSTNQAVFYNNAVIKPSYWGPFAKEQNWWLAVGGLEWALPVQEHGYVWGLPWTASPRRVGDSVVVSLESPTDDSGLRAQVEVELAADEPRFTVDIRLTNGSDRSLPVQFWANAMLAPGASTLAADAQFLFPVSSVVVHSSGDTSLPAERQSIPWPEVNGRDLSRYANWRNWLGIFAEGALPESVGVYNPQADFGVLRELSGGFGGVKLFAFGSDFPDRGTYTDDGSEYAELWVGANRTFWPEDDVLLAPGQSLGWREAWALVTDKDGIGGASEQTAISFADDP